MSINKSDNNSPHLLMELLEDNEEIEYFVQVNTIGHIIGESFLLIITVPLSLIMGFISFLIVAVFFNAGIGVILAIIVSILVLISPFIYGLYKSFSSESYYCITNKRFIERRKIKSNNTYNHTSISNVKKCRVNASLFDRVLNYGNIIIETKDEKENIVFSEVKEFDKLKDIIEDKIQEQDIENNIDDYEL
jgi:hypothetical protein